MNEITEESLFGNEETQELSLSDVLEFAMALHQENRFDAAEEVYRSILKQVPDHPDVMHFFGLLRHQQGHPVEGAEWISKALEVVPDYVDARNNLGNIYLQTGDFERAEQCFRKVLELRPDFVAAYGNLGVALTWLEQYDEAIAMQLEAIARDPQPAHYYQNLGNTFQKAGNYERAVEAYQDALARRVYDPDTYKNLSRTFYLMGKIDSALKVLEQWLEHEPDNATALHMRSAYTGQSVPERASDDYVRQTFDGFAESFDMVLKRLEYKAPFLVDQALKSVAGDRLVGDVLDVGCGTGLCGPLVRQRAARLVGMDLSSKMLERARNRGVYDELHEAELTEFMARSHAEYDVLLCADTLCYFGDLAGASEAAYGALKPGGWFIFTLEKLEDDSLDTHLNLHGRYSHSEPYVRRVVQAAGFSVTDIGTAALRLEFGKPVTGMVVTVQKP
jgi:predicted TPR repeat methyltransferase